MADETITVEVQQARAGDKVKVVNVRLPAGPFALAALEACGLIEKCPKSTSRRTSSASEQLSKLTAAARP